MSGKRIILKPGREKSLHRHHPWVFSGAVSASTGRPADGDWVDVCDAEGNFLAGGHFQPGSITVRVIKDSPGEADTAFWTHSLQRAADRRKAIIQQEKTSVFRLVHGEGDYLPGLIIDIYNDVAVVQAHSTGMLKALPEIARCLQGLDFPNVKAVYNKSAATVHSADHVADGFVVGSGDEEVVVKENGLLFHVNFVKGQKTGFFIDQRDNRDLLRSLSAGKSVCNLFSYTGGFSVYALAGGAAETVSIDASKHALELAEANVQRNGFTNHRTECMDILRDFRNDSNVYDIIVVDPPAFAKQLSQRTRAMKAYSRLNADVLEKVKPGGLVLTFSCSQAVGTADFRSAIYSASLAAGKKVRIIKQLTQAPDHAVNIFHPEGEYLKGLVLMVE